MEKKRQYSLDELENMVLEKAQSRVLQQILELEGDYSESIENEIHTIVIDVLKQVTSNNMRKLVTKITAYKERVESNYFRELFLFLRYRFTLYVNALIYR